MVEKKTKSTKVAKVEAETKKSKVVSRKPLAKTTAESSLKVALYDATGKEKGTVTLPEAVFGAKINPVLMAQAVRVFLTNQRMGSAHTKTRGQVDGSTRKIYRQKGTGRARHGAVRAPIFVGGGIAHGPKTKDFALSLPTKMKKAAVVSALSQMAKEGSIKVVAGFAKIEPKTKTVAALLAGIGLSEKKALLVMPEYVENVLKAGRNIKKMEITTVSSINTYAVLNAGTLILMEEAVQNFEKQFGKTK